jgi:hypothetical protein
VRATVRSVATAAFERGSGARRRKWLHACHHIGARMCNNYSKKTLLSATLKTKLPLVLRSYTKPQTLHAQVSTSFIKMCDLPSRMAIESELFCEKVLHDPRCVIERE